MKRISNNQDITEQRAIAELVGGSEVLRQTAYSLTPAIVAVAEEMISALQGGSKLLICGNGGSAADAQHFAAELVGRFRRERPSWSAMALTVDASVLTSISNDFGFEQVFARQVQAVGRPGDILVAISTSGRSHNVLAAVKAASALGIRTIGRVGRHGRSSPAHPQRQYSFHPARTHGRHPCPLRINRGTSVRRGCTPKSENRRELNRSPKFGRMFGVGGCYGRRRASRDYSNAKHHGRR